MDLRKGASERGADALPILAYIQAKAVLLSSVQADRKAVRQKITMWRFGGFYENGTYRVDCNGTSIYV